MKLKEYLDARGERQEDFARRAGLSQGTISAMVRGANKPLLENALKVAKAAAEEPAPGGGVVAIEDLLIRQEPTEAAG